eukprot:c7780_g1_i1 orf=268-531(+)
MKTFKEVLASKCMMMEKTRCEDEAIVDTMEGAKHVNGVGTDNLKKRKSDVNKEWVLQILEEQLVAASNSWTCQAPLQCYNMKWRENR